MSRDGWEGLIGVSTLSVRTANFRLLRSLLAMRGKILLALNLFCQNFGQREILDWRH